MKTEEANIPIFWKKGDATRAWAKSRSLTPADMAPQAIGSKPVEWEIVADAIIEAGKREEENEGIEIP